MPNMSNTFKASDLIQGNYFQNDNDSLLFTKIYKEQPGRSDSNWWIEELWVSIKEEFWGRADVTSSLSAPVTLMLWRNPPKTLFEINQQMNKQILNYNGSDFWEICSY